MKKFILIISAILVAGTYSNSVGTDKGGGVEVKSYPEAIEVELEMNEFNFIPEHLEFETGKLYRLKIENTGYGKHELDSQQLAASVYTRKVVVLSKEGRMIAEIKGKPSEIELASGQTAEWWFVPVEKHDEVGEMICDIPGHLGAGMSGTVNIR